MIRRWDVAVIAALLLAAVLIGVFAFRDPGSVLIVEINGDIVDEIRLADLAGEQTRVYPVGENRITVCFDRGGAWIAASDCPNHLCIRSGKITHAGQSVLCLPLRVCLRLSGSGETVDGVTG